MVLSFVSRSRSIRPSILLLSCGLVAGCEELIGAEFDDFSRDLDDATTTADGTPAPDASDGGDGQRGAIPDTGVPIEGGSTFCTPGEIHDIAACSHCGRYVQICNPQRNWDSPFCRQEPDACTPGTKEQRPCEGDGTQTATCTANCTWMLDACQSSTCVPNQIDKQPCGRCGTQSRTCLATDVGWRWTPFSMCGDQKECAANDVERESCGKCGSHGRTCTMSCTWGSWEVCQGEGECTPGDVQERTCLIGLLKQSRTCSDRCTWGDWIGLCV